MVNILIYNKGVEKDEPPMACLMFVIQYEKSCIIFIIKHEKKKQNSIILVLKNTNLR